MTHIRALSLITHGEAPEISKYVNVNFRFGNILTLLSKELLDKIFIDNFFVSSKLILVNQHDNVLNVKVKSCSTLMLRQKITWFHLLS